MYKHKCDQGHEFTKSVIHDHCHCPECGELSRYIRPPEPSRVGHYDVAEPFRVLSGDGIVLQDRQCRKSMPDWQDTKPIEYAGTPKPIVSRNGNVYYPRKQRGG